MSDNSGKTSNIEDTTVDEATVTRVLYGRIGKGKDVIKELKEIVRKEGIKGGSIVLLGALSKAKLGYYDMNKKNYKTLEHGDEGLLEMTGTGFIAVNNGEPIVHIHVSVGDECISYTGHMMDGGNIVGAVVEYTIFGFDRDVKKVKDEGSGLHIIEGAKFTSGSNDS